MLDSTGNLQDVAQPTVGSPSGRREGAKALSAGADTLDRIVLIEKAIEDIRPYLQRDGGDCELVDVSGNTIYVKLRGACVGCHMASVTISGVQERLIAKLGVALRVIPVG